MYRPYSNVCFNNCYDFIMKSKAEKEVWELSTSLTFDNEEEMRWELDRISDLAENIMNAEYDLCEMEMDALYDAMQYDAVFEGNAFRTAKKANRRKQNKKNKNRDRIHGRRHGGAHGGVDFRYVDCNPFCNKHQYVDAMFATNGKHRHNADKKASAMSAREQEYLFSEQETEDIIPVREIKSEESKVEGVGLEDFLWYLIDRLPEQKYIVLYNSDNGKDWEDHDYDTNRFLGVMTKDKVIAELTERFLHNTSGVDVSDTINAGLKGIEFNWDFGCDEWGWWNGYESYTVIPVSEI